MAQNPYTSPPSPTRTTVGVPRLGQTAHTGGDISGAVGTGLILLIAAIIALAAARFVFTKGDMPKDDRK